MKRSHISGTMAPTVMSQRISIYIRTARINKGSGCALNTLAVKHFTRCSTGHVLSTCHQHCLQQSFRVDLSFQLRKYVFPYRALLHGFKEYVDTSKELLRSQSVQIIQKSRSHLKILGAMWVTCTRYCAPLYKI